MSDETKDFLSEATEDAVDALNDCIKVFTQLARTGHYPEPLMGRGWEFVIDARNKLTAAAKQAGLREDEEVDINYSFGSE